MDYNPKKFFPEDIKGIINRLLYLKMYFGWAWGWIVYPFSIINGLASVLVFLKIFNLWSPLLVGIIGIILFVLLIVFGWVLRIKNIVQREAEFALRYSPPIQKLLENTKKDEF